MPSKAQEHPIYERHLELLHLILTPTCMQRKTKFLWIRSFFSQYVHKKYFNSKGYFSSFVIWK